MNPLFCILTDNISSVPHFQTLFGIEGIVQYIAETRNKIYSIPPAPTPIQGFAFQFWLPMVKQDPERGDPPD